MGISTMEQWICIHGHFYQPPRENPWLEDIEIQDSAYPYQNWNERIAAECYAPNAASRILDGEGKIIKIANNYARISFNFGPTLLNWLRFREPSAYREILEADQLSKKYFNGHGSAIAQAYNHLILPLASRRDKETQIKWGIQDFVFHFGRQPEGMWLPETAVDMESLELMAEHGIKFVILAPHQAKRARKIGDATWKEIGPGGINPLVPYQVYLPSNRKSLAVFFYHGPVSHAVAFENLLDNGERFARRLLSGFSSAGPAAQLVSIATDGETYGHHHHHGDMALSYALNFMQQQDGIRLTNYGEFLEHYPPTWEVEIRDDTSWSCVHGVERWRSNCGCNSGGRPGWSQSWRTPLRLAFDWLRDTLTSQYEANARLFLKDPWTARNAYISVLLQRNEETREAFLAEQAIRPLNPAEQITVFKLLELQRNLMLMYTSCGWFFDDISGIETVQVIQYAARAIQLAYELFGSTLEPRFLDFLRQAKSNLPEHQDGAYIYEHYVKPRVIDLLNVGAHFAISSLFEKYETNAQVYCYSIGQEDRRLLEAGMTKLVLGRAKVTSDITQESALLNYGVLYFGDHNVNAGVQNHRSDELYQEMVNKISEAFRHSDLPGVIRYLDRSFEGTAYSLKQLFQNDQRKILESILITTLEEIRAEYHHIYERHAALMQFLKSTSIPLPRPLHTAAEIDLNSSLARAFKADIFNLDYINLVLSEANMLNIVLDSEGLGFELKRRAERVAETLQRNPLELRYLQELDATATVARMVPFEVNLWKVQNIYYRLLNTSYQTIHKLAEKGNETMQQWVSHFDALGDKLRMRRGA